MVTESANKVNQFCYQNSLHNLVGLVPLANVNIHVPTHTKVVGLDIAIVVVALVHSREHLGQERKRLTVVVTLEMVRVHLTVLARVRAKALRHLVVVGAANSVAVGDEVDLARLQIQTQSRVVANRESALDTILLEDSLNLGGNLCFLLLTHICHFALRFSTLCNYIRPNRDQSQPFYTKYNSI